MCAATGLRQAFALYIPELVPLPFKIFQWPSTIHTLEKVQLEPISSDFMEGRELSEHGRDGLEKASPLWLFI